MPLSCCLYRSDIDRRYICSQVQTSSYQNEEIVRHGVAGETIVRTSKKYSYYNELNDLNPVLFDALLALAGRVANALFGFQRLDAGTSQGTGVNVNIARAAV